MPNQRPGQPQIVIDFQFNPMNLADKRTANYAPLAASGALLPSSSHLRRRSHAHLHGTIDGTSVDQLDGPRIAVDEDGGTGLSYEIRALAYPDAGLAERRVPLRRVHRPVRRRRPRDIHLAAAGDVRFGDQVIDRLVTEISITETLFMPTLAPLDVDVTVTLSQLNPYQLDVDGTMPRTPPMPSGRFSGQPVTEVLALDGTTRRVASSVSAAARW